MAKQKLIERRVFQPNGEVGKETFFVCPECEQEISVLDFYGGDPETDMPTPASVESTLRKHADDWHHDFVLKGQSVKKLVKAFAAP